MWLECSECGESFETDEQPSVCDTCGTAGSVFVEIEDPWSDPQPGSLNACWIEAGFERARRLLGEPRLADA